MGSFFRWTTLVWQLACLLAELQAEDTALE